MKENDLFQIIGDIDNEKIEEAYNAKSGNKNFALLKRLSFAACFVLIAVISFSVVNEKNAKKVPQKEEIAEEQEKGGEEVTSENLPQEEKLETNNSVDTLTDTEKQEKTETSNGVDALPEAEKQETGSEKANPESFSNEDNMVVDEAAREESSDQTSGGGGGFGGGSSGGSSSESSDSQNEEFSLDYLNLLHEKITEMATNEEISSIVSSYVDENANKVVVSVTSMEKDLIDRIKALDIEGGAIEFKTVELQ